MIQYQKIKDEHKGCLLFFRLGDFYELFFDDAILVSKELQLTLTKRDSGGGERAPMCGVPYHARDNYVMRLVNKGYKVAICDQLSDPAQSKGIVDRGVIQIVTPGTVIDGSLLEQDVSNYLCCLYLHETGFGLSFSDVSTGVIYVSSHEIDINKSQNIAEIIINEISKFSPVEILFNEALISIKGLDVFLKERLKCVGELIDNEKFELQFTEQIIKEHYNGKSLKELELSDKPLAVAALGVLLDYINYTQTKRMQGEFTLKIHDGKQYLEMDLNTYRNLELLKPLTGDGKTGSLKWVLNQTKTPMGNRLVEHTICHPLVILPEINARQDAVGEFVYATIKRQQIREKLADICDLERISAKISNNTINPPELKKLANSLAILPEIKQFLTGFTSSLIKKQRNNINDFSKVVQLIENALCEKLPVSLKDGGIIKSGFNPKIDELRRLETGGKEELAALEMREKEATGIPKLKIGYNRVFGYYIEVTNSYKNKVPDTYTRKQTLANCERYITDELKELEVKLNSASEECITLEQEVYEEIKDFTSGYLKKIKVTSEALSWLDLLCSFAKVSVDNNYTCPEMTLDGEIIIENGRHPVVEKLLKTTFVPNDSLLDNNQNRVNIITGPNMAGKSTYMKQIAMINILAQTGCFVPASKAKIPVADAIFTRIGASDDMVGGQSTFMVEMKEAAYILKNCTEHSLIILDEIGRGTSTFDGMSIAKAIIVELAKAEKGSKTLFSTHYHELCELENELERVKNYNAMVKRQVLENGDESLIFINKIVPGGSDDSFGIDVAALAGVPMNVLDRAKVYLKELQIYNEQVTDNR